MAAVSDPAGFEELCRRFLNGDESCIRDFEKQARPLIRRIARRYA